MGVFRQNLSCTTQEVGVDLTEGASLQVRPRRQGLALIECWFGPFPPWHDLYLKTVELNQDVHFIIGHDAPRPSRRPSNVRWIQMTRQDLETRAKAVLGFPVALSSGLKTTDLRPAFGAIFAEELRDFAYWGYNDSDLFWGRIMPFMAGPMGSGYDVITACRTSIVGQFTAFRNSVAHCAVYRLIPRYAEQLNQPQLGYMDECTLDQACEKAGWRIYRRQLQVHDLGSTEWEQRALELHRKEDCADSEWFWEAGRCRWEQGRLIHVGSGREVMFFHFKSWKRVWRENYRVPRLAYWDTMLRGFEVDGSGLRILPRRYPWLVRPAYWIRYHLPLRTVSGLSRASAYVARVPRGLRRRLSYMNVRWLPASAWHRLHR